MDKYWRTIVCTDIRDLGCHSECFKCLLENELCSPWRWKAIEETATAKEWVYAVIAAEAITKIGIMEELPPVVIVHLYTHSTVVTMQPIQKLSVMTLHAKGGKVVYQGDSRWCTAPTAKCSLEHEPLCFNWVHALSHLKCVTIARTT